MKTTLKKKTPAPLSVEQRIAQAQALSGAALSTFASAANDLELAAQLKTELADDIETDVAGIQAEIHQLTEQVDDKRAQQDDLDAAAEGDLAAAKKIRDLFAV